MLHVACVKSGTLYGPEYVNILYDMVRRNLGTGQTGKFYCLTDDPTGLDAGIDRVGLPDFGEFKLEGWWNKLALFREGIFPKGERVVYFDLDTVITGPIDALYSYDGDFAILRDFNRWNGYQSSVMCFKGGIYPFVWSDYITAGCPDLPGGDQEWIEKKIGGADILQDLYPGDFCSYKIHARHGLPRGVKCVVFHGHPRPHEVQCGWVHKIWQIGGGSSAEFEMLANSSDEQIRSNVLSCIARQDLSWLEGKPEHDGHAVILGGGPSLKQFLPEIEWRHKQGQTLFATNNVAKYLSATRDEHNIEYIDHMVVIDSRKDNLPFLEIPNGWVRGEYYFASQTHPDLLDVAKPTIFHLHVDGMMRAIAGDPRSITTPLIGGGRTVGMNAIVLAYALGYRKIHLYGMDSSYCDDKHHAYHQQLNDGDQRIEVEADGRKFVTTPWMVDQVESFERVCAALVPSGCMITVHGDGLLPAIARTMQTNVTEELEDRIKIDGVWWPKGDTVCRPSVLGTVSDIDTIMDYVKGRKACVQAGGNVGVWAKRLAKDFQKVYTFEPDIVNFKCLAANCNEDNIIKFQCALGKQPLNVSLLGNRENCGAHYVNDHQDDQVLDAIVPCVALDHIPLPACDLIQLDIEGYEYNALLGAKDTIQKFKPVIVLEEKGLVRRYGQEESDEFDGLCASFLQHLGYTKVLRVHNDNVYVYTE